LFFTAYLKYLASLRLVRLGNKEYMGTPLI